MCLRGRGVKLSEEGVACQLRDAPLLTPPWLVATHPSTRSLSFARILSSPRALLLTTTKARRRSSRIAGVR